MLGLSTNTNQGDIQKCVSPFTFNLKKIWQIKTFKIIGLVG